MKAYVATTGAVFGLLALVHLWRIVEEGHALAMDPWFALVTIVAAVLCVWALRVFRRIPR